MFRLTGKEELLGNVKTGSNLGSSDHEEDGGFQDQEDYNPGFKRADFSLFKDLLRIISQKMVL